MSAATRLLIQVVAQLTPGRCGVSDHAVLLSRALKSEFAIDTAFVVLNSNERCDLPYLAVYCPPSQLLESCLELSEGQPGAMLVHVSGYGYSADGAPRLLADALADVKASGWFRVAVYFHELFAKGMPWRKAFWFSHRQRRVVRRIAEEADLLATNIGHHAAWLESEAVQRCKTPVRLLPVISTVGETQEPAPLVRRKPALAVFGLPETRRRSYRALSASGDLLSSLGVKEIFDIGPECDTPSALGHIPVRCMGMRTAEDLAALFSELAFGFVSSEPHCLAKSGVFASYCAQGTIPVLANSFSGEVDGLRDGVHLVSPQTVNIVLASGLESCSRAAWRWYAAHRLHVHAEFYAQWLEGAKPGGMNLSTSQAVTDAAAG